MGFRSEGYLTRLVTEKKASDNVKNNHGMVRCDGEFETVGEDLDMSTTSFAQGPQKYVAPDISRELAMLGMDKNFNQIKEDKRMLPIGTKVIVRGGDDYKGKCAGKIGTVCTRSIKTAKLGVMIDGIKNPESKDGIFWIKEAFLMPYKEPTTMMSASDVKNVIFSGGKTIVLWADGTKTMVSCGEGDTFDPYAGFCAALAKKVFGTTRRVKRIIEKSGKGLPAKKEAATLPDGGGLNHKEVP